jgi:hypothetical protein
MYCSCCGNSTRICNPFSMASNVKMASKDGGGGQGGGGGGVGSDGDASSSEQSPAETRASMLGEEVEAQDKIDRYPLSTRSWKLKEKCKRSIVEDNRIFVQIRRQGVDEFCGSCHLDKSDKVGVIRAKKVTYSILSS